MSKTAKEALWSFVVALAVPLVITAAGVGVAAAVGAEKIGNLERRQSRTDDVLDRIADKLDALGRGVSRIEGKLGHGP
jgi:hypothetical protein